MSQRLRNASVFLVLILLALLSSLNADLVSAQTLPWWEVQSVDTMKYSRDRAREFLTDPDSEAVIQDQVQKIRNLGATHVSLGTPYDTEFLPILRRWVAVARQEGLKVWFRGNWSGWEGWFDYPRTLSRSEHRRKTSAFIRENPDLFEDGDLFTACPECENGGPGDPRKTGDVAGFRAFLIDEYSEVQESFQQLQKSVDPRFTSMNGDVAQLVMDRATTERLGGVITIDHYVRTPQQLNKDIERYAQLSGGKVMLGEFGAPIPDIHGALTPQQQADWIGGVLSLLQNNPHVLGMSYWTSHGGSTQLWSGNRELPAAQVLRQAYTPRVIRGQVLNERDEPVTDAKVSTPRKSANVDQDGRFSLAVILQDEAFTVEASEYHAQTLFMADVGENEIHIQLEKVAPRLCQSGFKLWQEVCTKGWKLVWLKM